VCVSLCALSRHRAWLRFLVKWQCPAVVARIPPSPFAGVYRAGSTLSLNIEVVAPECSVSLKFWQKWTAVQVIPIITGTMLVLAFAAMNAHRVAAFFSIRARRVAKLRITDRRHVGLAAGKAVVAKQGADCVPCGRSGGVVTLAAPPSPRIRPFSFVFLLRAGNAPLASLCTTMIGLFTPNACRQPWLCAASHCCRQFPVSMWWGC
jgi:hypothetical protein